MTFLNLKNIPLQAKSFLEKQNLLVIEILNPINALSEKAEGNKESSTHTYEKLIFSALIEEEVVIKKEYDKREISGGELL